MNLRRFFALSFITTATLTLSGCTSVKIKDFPVCADIGTQGATCDNFLTSNPKVIPQPVWDDVRFGQLCIKSDDFGELKREIEQLCSSRRDLCDYETEQAIHAFFQRMDRLAGLH